MICERCSKPVHEVEVCNYCNKKMCESCKKATKRVHKINRYIICKSCWGNLSARKKWKKL